MNLNITPEIVADAVSIQWTVAMRYLLEGNRKMADFAFSGISDHLDGMWMMANYGADHDNQQDEMEELLEAIEFLRKIAYKHSSALYHIENDKAA